MQRGVRAIVERYPAATLQDVYKSMFQDSFGVAHLLGSRESVRRYIGLEVAMLDDDYCPESYVTPCGWRGDYLRVDLAAVRDGVISLDDLTDAFMRSAECGIAADVPALNAWQREWRTIVEAGYEQLRVLEGFVRDSTYIAELIDRGCYVVHHSPTYNACYAPHYRIVHRDVVEQIASLLRADAGDNR